MPFTTDSTGNIFIGASYDMSVATFAADLDAALTQAFGAGNYATQNLSATRSTLAGFRLEFRPQGVGETLSGTITPNTNQALYREDLAVLHANARLGVIPFNLNSSGCSQLAIRAGANPLYVTASTTRTLDNNYTRFLATITPKEIIFLAAHTDWSNSMISYIGVLQNSSTPFGFPVNCAGFTKHFVSNSSHFETYLAPWVDQSAGSLLTPNYAPACQAGTGTFGTDLWMSDFVFRHNRVLNNYPFIGHPNNLRIAVGASVTVGNLYRYPEGSASPYWLCIGTASSDKKLMMRIKT
jgi:hypothetical protein